MTFLDLRMRFLSLLPLRIAEMSDALDHREPLDRLVRRFHDLAGTAGTYGLPAVSELAAEGEEVCARATSYDDAIVADLRFLIERITSRPESSIDRERVSFP